MAVVTIDSNRARYNWRTVLDAAEKGDAVITRYGKPIAAVIDHDTWLAVHKYIEAYRRARIRREIDEWRRDPSTARPWSEIQAEMIAEGLLDAPPT